jgi:hypothetical protein
MTTPATGPLKFSEINTELGLGSTTQRSMSSALVRTLAGVASGAISFSSLRGKSNRQVVTYVISADVADKVITLGSTAPTSGTYVAGRSDCTITIGSGIYVYGTVAGDAGLTVSGGAAGDTLAIVNNGIIMGLGGNGESAYASASTVGNTALNITTSVSGTVAITNNSYIVGGGGGGAAYKDLASGNWGGGGGGGAGGGSGGATAGPGWLGLPRAGGSGGTIGNAGTSGTWAYNSASTYQHTFSGGGGGRRLPFTAGGASGGSTGVSASASSGSGAMRHPIAHPSLLSPVCMRIEHLASLRCTFPS